jgi:type I restriction enzyme, S subunit
MDVKPGFKRTELGVLPYDWQVFDFVSFGKVIDGDRGIHYPGADDLRESGFCLFLNAGNVTKTGFKFDDCQFVSREKDRQLNKGKLIRGDVILTTRGTIGNFAYYGPAVPFENIRINSGMVVLRNSSTEVLNSYQYLALRSGAVKSQLERLSFGSAQPQLTVKGIGTLKIPLPPTKAEQESIAEALSDADAFIDSLEQLIAKKRQIKQGAMQELLTGKRRLPGFARSDGHKHTELGVIPEDWDVTKLTKICSMKSGETITSARIDSFSEYPCYGGNGLRGFTARYTHKGRFALVGRQGALCGNVLGAEGQFFASEHAIVVTASTQTGIGWLTIALREMRLNQYSESSAQPGLSVSKLLQLSVVCPSTKDEQEAIADVLANMDAELAALTTKLAKARQIKQGMMQELLTGRIRLV